MISHYNVIANTMQIGAFDELSREHMKPKGTDVYLENALGLLPLSHIYGLVVIANASIYRGDGVVILPKFEVQSYLKAVQDYKVNTLYLVPPIIILMTKNPQLLAKYDLSAVKAIFTGAAPLGKETADELNKIYPSWFIRQGYGLTETSTVVTSTPTWDIVLGSSGVIVTDCVCRIVTVDGKEVTGYDEPGELWVSSPAVVIGYLNNEKANRESFVIGDDGRRYMRTGDEALIRKSAEGNEHVYIVDRIKELIKVKVRSIENKRGRCIHTNASIGSASGTGRTRSPSSHSPSCRRLRRYSCIRRTLRRSAKGFCRQVCFNRSRGK